MNAANDEYEFLPAALEVQETPPSPIGRAITWVIVTFFSVTIIWAMLGHIDIVAVAQGKIIPNGKSKMIQPLEAGVIQAILVKEGQIVKQGDVLIKLDPTIKQADLDSLTSQRHTLLAKQARLDAIMRAVARGSADVSYKHPGHVPTSTSKLEEQQAIHQMTTYLGKVKQIQSQINERNAEYKNIQAQKNKLSKILPIIKKRANAMFKLSEKKLASEVEYLELEQRRIETAQDLTSTRFKLEQINASIDELKQQQAVIKADFEQNIFTELNEIKQTLKSTEQEWTKANSLTQLQTLMSPIDGVVQQLAINTVGGVVTPAQVLMMIVPNNQSLEVEAMLPNKDVGFVEEGYEAEIKIESFPFTKYGIIEGKVKMISNEAITQEKIGLVYSMQVSMDKNTMKTKNRVVQLSPGMNVTVEVKTGERRLIEYFLAPLLRYKSESLGER
jgi:hemolysin D